MTKQEINNAIYQKYIAPTEKPRKKFIGIEIEMPIVNLAKKPVEEAVVFEMAETFREYLKFESVNYDDNGNINSMADERTGDELSFDCSYSNLELSLGKGETLFEIKERFDSYYRFINKKLSEHNYTLTGMGINPYYNINLNKPVPNERYRMLYHHLHTYKKYEHENKTFHSFPQFGTFTSASQVQLDADKENVIGIINCFGRLEPYKALLFSNSYFPEMPEFLCSRNVLWERSMQGYNPHNIGMFDYELESISDLVEYIKTTSIYCTMRSGKYINFTPVSIAEYLQLEKVSGEYFDGKNYTDIEFKPHISDLEYLRTFKFEDLTFRGTIEFRSMCCQPISDVMTVSAFHLGLMENFTELEKLLDGDDVIYKHGYNASELQRMLSMREIPLFIDKNELSKQLIRIIDIAKTGLINRGNGEECFLSPLFNRAKELINPAKALAEGLDRGMTLEYFISEYSKS